MEITKEMLDNELATIDEEYAWYQAAAPSDKRLQLGRRLIELMKELESRWLTYAKTRGGVGTTGIDHIENPVDFQHERLRLVIAACQTGLRLQGRFGAPRPKTTDS